MPSGTPPPPITPPDSPQCCFSVVPSTSAAASAIAGLLGIDLTGIDVPVGLSCSPITALGNNWSAESLRLSRHFTQDTSDGMISLICDAPKKEWAALIAINCVPLTA